MKLSKLSIVLILIGSTLPIKVSSGSVEKPLPNGRLQTANPTENEKVNLNPRQRIDQQSHNVANEERSKSNGRHYAAEPSKEESPSGLSSPAPTSQPTTAARDQDTQQKDWFDWYTAFGPTTWANWSVALLAIVAGIVGYCTLRSINNQVRLGIAQLRAARMAVSAARRSAEAAESAAKASEAALKSDRPYLLIERADIFGIQRMDDKTGAPTHEIAVLKSFSPHATFTFRNYGKGPALIDESVMRLCPISKMPAPGDFTACKSTETPRNARGDRDAVRAGETWNISSDPFDALISPEDYAEILNGTKIIAVWGRVQYKDVFKDSKPYETIFCYQLQPTFDLFIARDNLNVPRLPAHR
jgi:hypothetical protein